MEEFDTIYHYDPTASTTNQIASSTTLLSTTTQPIATTSDIVILPTMTAGEVLIAFFLFVLVLLSLARMLFSALDRVRTKRKIMAYAGGDVEIRNDI